MIQAKWLIVFITALLIAANVLLGIVLTSNSREAMKTLLDDRMLDISNTAADMLNGDELEALTAADKDTPEYRRVHDALTFFRKNIELKYIYCIQIVGEKEFAFSVDPTLEDPGEFGAPVVYTDALYRASKGIPSADAEPYTDEWGRFYSAYSPVFDSRGKVAGIVAVDFSAEWYDDQIAKQTHSIIACIALSLVMCVLLGLVVAKRNNDLEIALKNVENMRNARDHYKNESEIDQLTGSLNKITTERLVEKYLKERQAGKVTALYVLDLDNFKEANDTHGHDYGDEILVAFASLLRHGFRPNDIVGRFGGDEFIVLLSDLPDISIVERNARYMMKSALNLEIRGRNAGMSVSIGIALAPQDGISYDELFKAADRSLYKVKYNGRNGYSIGREKVVHGER